jgi:hypothetical protein
VSTWLLLRLRPCPHPDVIMATPALSWYRAELAKGLLADRLRSGRGGSQRRHSGSPPYNLNQQFMSPDGVAILKLPLCRFCGHARSPRN